MMLSLIPCAVALNKNACLQGRDACNSGLQDNGGLPVQHAPLLDNLHVWSGLRPHAAEWGARQDAQAESGKGTAAV